MCFSASIPNSTIAAVYASRSRLSTKRFQFTLMRSSIGVISFSSNSRNVSRLSKNGSSNCLDGTPRFGKHGLKLCFVQGVSENRQRARQRAFSHCAAPFFLWTISGREQSRKRRSRRKPRCRARPLADTSARSAGSLGISGRGC